MELTEHSGIERALHFIDTSMQDSPSLEEIAKVAGLSPFHFQRLFRRWVGVSPKRYMQNLVASRAKPLLREGKSLLDTSYDLGLSSPGRLHDLFVSVEAVTPGEYKARGRTLTLKYGIHLTPFGPCCIAMSEKGICNLSFLETASELEALEFLRKEWPEAAFEFDPDSTGETIYRIFTPVEWDAEYPFHLHLRGTNFQLQVWRALLQIPSGTTLSYSEVSERAGHSRRATRAAASAVAVNPVVFLIPCHRVIRKSGELGGYRYGVERKRLLLDSEES